MSDGGLRQLFRRHLPELDWQGVETWSTGQGVPDMNFIDGWVENKVTHHWKVEVSPEQVAWAERRIRKGGKVFVAIRRVSDAGPRKGEAADELTLAWGNQLRPLIEGERIDTIDYFGVWPGGPAGWDWEFIKTILLMKVSKE
jgi:hypothetical protein